MKTDKTGGAMLKSAAGGCAVTLCVTILLAAVSGMLIHSGVVPPAGMRMIACVITIGASMLGAVYCGTHTPRWKLPICVLSVFLYLICVFILRGAVFGPDTSQKWGVPICAVAAAVAGAMLSGMRKRR